MPNTFVWVDIPVHELDRAIKFYSEMLGAPVIKEGGQGFQFGLLPQAGHDQVSGCLFQSSETQPSQHGPLVYFNVSGRLDAAMAAVELGGGKVLQGKHQIGPHGYRAIVQDSEGNRVAIHSPTP